MVDGATVVSVFAMIGIMTVCTAICIAGFVAFDFILSLKKRLTPPCSKCKYSFAEHGTSILRCKSPKAVNAYEKKTCSTNVTGFPAVDVRGKRTCKFRHKAGGN